jgi:hypothetical protein
VSNCGLTHGLFYLARTSVTQIAFLPPVCVTVHVQVRSEFHVPHSREANLTCRGSAGLCRRRAQPSWQSLNRKLVGFMDSRAGQDVRG